MIRYESFVSPGYRRDRVECVGLLLGHGTTDPRGRRQRDVCLVQAGRARADRRRVQVRDAGDHDGVGGESETLGDVAS